MVIYISALRPVTTVLECAVCSEVFCKGLSGENVAAVALVAQYLDDASGGPVDVPEI